MSFNGPREYPKEHPRLGLGSAWIRRGVTAAQRTGRTVVVLVLYVAALGLLRLGLDKLFFRNRHWYDSLALGAIYGLTLGLAQLLLLPLIFERWFPPNGKPGPRD